MPSSSDVPQSIGSVRDLPSGVVTFVLTDVVGSTQLWERVPHLMEDTLAVHDYLVETSISDHHGVLLKNRGEGDSTFSVFRLATDAAAAARTIDQQLSSYPWPEDCVLRVRIAIHTGQALERGGDYYGRAVNRAARLRAVAGPGEVLVSRSTAELIVDHLPSDIALVELGDRQLKDLERKEMVHQLVTRGSGRVAAPRRELSAPSISLPPPLALAARRFVGRIQEQELLLRFLNETLADSQARLILIEGEPGIGKTSLAAKFSGAAHDDGIPVIYARCDGDTAISYEPWRQLISSLDPAISSGGSKRGMDLWSYFEGSRPMQRIDSVEPETARYLLLRAVLEALAEAAKEHGLIIVMDDLHWSDPQSLQLVRHLASNCHQIRVLFIGTFRETEATTGSSLAATLAGLRREPSVVRISLKGLSDSELLDMMEARAGHSLGADGIALRDALLAETDGNPFFAGELLHHLTETDAIRKTSEGRWVGTSKFMSEALPISVHEVIEERVSRLGSEAAAVLTMAAVIGKEFDLELLALATQQHEDLLLDILDAAAAAALVREVSMATARYGFTHALIQHTLYDGLAVARRARLHRRVGEALEQATSADPGARVNELAHHWIAATVPTDLAKALTYARLAGTAALERLAPEDAIRYFSQALDLYMRLPTSAPQMQIDLLIGLGTAQRQVGDPEYRETLLTAARLAEQNDDATRLVQSALAADRGFYTSMGRRDDNRVMMLRKALSAVGSIPSAERARLLAMLANELTWTGHLVERRALAAEAVEVARLVADPVTLIQVAHHATTSIQVPETLAERLAYTKEALELARDLADPGLLHWAAAARSICAVQAGLPIDIEESFALMVSAAELVREPTLIWHSRFRSASLALLKGDPGRAEQLAAEARDIGVDSGQPDAANFFAPQIAMVRWQQGRLGELVPNLKEVADRTAMPVFVALLALAQTEQGDTSSARVLLETAAADAFAQLPRNQTWISTLVCWSEVAAEVRDERAARALSGLLLPFRGQLCYDRPTFSGAVDHWLGRLAAVLSLNNEAQIYFAAARETAQTVGAAWADACTALAWGKALMELNRLAYSDIAASLLGEALTAARLHGYGAVERRALAALG